MILRQARCLREMEMIMLRGKEYLIIKIEHRPFPEESDIMHVTISNNVADSTLALNLSDYVEMST